MRGNKTTGIFHPMSEAMRAPLARTPGQQKTQVGHACLRESPYTRPHPSAPSGKLGGSQQELTDAPSLFSPFIHITSLLHAIHLPGSESAEVTPCAPAPLLGLALQAS